MLKIGWACRCLVIIAALLALSAPVSANDIAALTAQVEPAVGLVRTYDLKGEPTGLGSGFFISSDGEFVTNRHVIAGAYTAVVEMASGKRYKVKKVLTAHPQIDLVKLLVETRQEPVSFLKLLAGLPQKGERIAAFGNPKGLKFTVSDGIVSAFQQDKFANTFIQYTAPTSPGNSGGPLVTMSGDVAGIVTFGATEGQNLNFALPAYMLGDLTEYVPESQGGQGPLLPPWGKRGSSGSGGKPVVAIDYWSNIDRHGQHVIDTVYNLVDRSKYQIADHSQFLANAKALFGASGPLVSVDKASLVAFGQKYGYDYILAVQTDMKFDFRYGKNTTYYTYRLTVKLRIIDVRQNQVLLADGFVVADTDTIYNSRDLYTRVIDQAVMRIETIQIFN